MSLKLDCLGHVPLTVETINDIYEGRRNLSENDMRKLVKAMCLSHERMRAELQGCEKLLAEDEVKFKQHFHATPLSPPIPYEAYHEYSQIVMCREAEESYEAAIVMAKELHKYKAAIPDLKGV